MRTRPAASLLLLLGCLAVVYYVGRLAPRYGIATPDSTFEAGGGFHVAAQEAARFQPLLRGAEGGQRPTVCYYEPLPAQGERMAFLYRFSWPDEKHPIPWIDRLYRWFRLRTFGTPEDVEYVWVEADLVAGVPVRLAFESPDVGKVFVGHETRLLPAGAFPVSGTHPVLAVSSWNHLFKTEGVRGAGRGESAGAVPLRFLDEALFQRLKIGRRSQPPAGLLTTSAPPPP